MPVPGEWSAGDEQAHQEMVTNLIRRTGQFTPATIANGAQWYKDAHQDAVHFGEVTGTSTETGAAAIARLSGGTEYNLNRLQALQVPKLSDKQVALITRATEISKEKAPKEQVTQLRRKAKLEGTALWHQTVGMVKDAIDLAQGAYKKPMEVFGERDNTSTKTPDFGESILTKGGTTNAPIDTHAYDAAHDSYHIPYGVGNKHLQKVGVYSAVQKAYVEAHAHAVKSGLVPSNTTLADFQAMHWVHHIAHKRVVNPKARSSAKASETKVRNILSRNPELEPTKVGLPPLSSSKDLEPSINPRLEHFTAGSAEGR